MISLLLSMVAARRGQALVVFLLSVFATAAAVAGPAYLAAADRAVVTNEIANSVRADRTVTLSVPSMQREQEGAFRSLASAALNLPGFRTVYTAQLPVLGAEPGVGEISYLVFREDLCANLRMVDGRCLMSPNEVVVGQEAARRLGLSPGDLLTVTWATYNPVQRMYLPAGEPYDVTVVGVYTPVDPDALYWGRTPYFMAGAPDAYREPIFTGRQVVDSIEHFDDYRAIDALAESDSLHLDRLAPLQEELRGLTERLSSEGGGFVHLTDSVSGLLDRMAESRALTRQVVPVAAVPLVVLCWFVIFVAVAAGTAARRTELGLLALRGTPRRARWLLAVGEPAIAIVLGAPVGYLLGSVAVGVLAGLRLEDGRFAPVTSGATVLAALGAVGGALLAGLLAGRRELVSSVAEQLRRVPPRSRAWASLLIEAVVIALAVVAVVQLRTFDGELVGLSVLAPALVGVAVALIAARVVAPLTGRFGAAALRRGRLGPALGLLHLARQPGNQRLFTLLTVTVMLTGYAVGAFDVAQQSRSARAEMQTGADRVLTVLPVNAGTLLTAVRAVDPDGEYAMAAGFTTATTAAAGDTKVLLADTSALAATARWRSEFGPAGPADVAAGLRPVAAEPVAIAGTELSVDVSLAIRSSGGPGVDPDVGADPDAGTVDDVRFSVHLRSPTGRAATVGVLVGPGQRSYLVPVDCADGCQLAGFSIRTTPRQTGGFPTNSGPQRYEVTLTGLAVDGNGVLGPAELSDERRWRDRSGAPGRVGPAGADGQAGPTGLRLLAGGEATDPWALPDDIPYPLPVLAARESGPPPGPGSPTVELTSGAHLSAEADLVAVLPALGNRGLLVDLEYAVRAVPENTPLDAAQVWLGARAPADVADRLAEQGLTITGEITPEQVRADLDRQAPALAIWFHLLAAGLAVLLACFGMVLLAMVERGRRAEDLGALLIQGLPARVAARSLLWSALPAVALATLAGLAGAALAWWATGIYLPVTDDSAVSLARIEWPHPVVVGLPVAGVMMLFAAVALALGRTVRVRD